MTSTHALRRFPALVVAATLLTACDSASTVGPDASFESSMQRATEHRRVTENRHSRENRLAWEKRRASEKRALAVLRRVTARYRDLDAALADGFILLHDCEVRPGEGAVGILYIHLDRYLDGKLDPELPDGLLYAPGEDGKPRLAGVELALPVGMWNSPTPPEFFGVPFQMEDEFAAFGLHIWAWRHNPDGMYAQAHPGISCGAES